LYRIPCSAGTMRALIAHGASLDRTVILLILLLVVLIGFGILGLWREWLPF
jgi:hypothetical protein